MNNGFNLTSPGGHELSKVLVNDQQVSGVLGDLLDGVELNKFDYLGLVLARELIGTQGGR